jgi:hypothetical protein
MSASHATATVGGHSEIDATCHRVIWHPTSMALTCRVEEPSQHQKRPKHLQQTEALFDHLVGRHHESVGDAETKRFSGLKINHHFKLD